MGNTGPLLMSDDIVIDIEKALYKSQPCQYWLNGHCGKGTSCQFAHGKEEIRPGAKFILCSGFERGECPHGSKVSVKFVVST